MRVKLVLVAVLALAVASPANADPAKVGYPNSIASTGDSITRAFNTCSFAFTDCTANSWSTGTASAVNSVYSRILARNPAISGKNLNDAKTGGKMTDLAGQVATVNTQHVDLVTILMGANDVCTGDVTTMTPTATLQAQLRTALDSLAAGSPDARIAVSSIPNVYHLWEVFHTSSSAVSTWNLFGICQALLKNATSTASADVSRRQQVAQRTVDDNAAIAQTCAQYVHCRFDGNAAYNLQFLSADVSTRDYFHPSVSGQAKAAATAWAATFDFSDATAPVSTAATAPDPAGGTDVTLSATDNAGVAGIEYRLGAATAWTRASGTVVVAAGTAITWRAVDVNGNIEATQTLTG